MREMGIPLAIHIKIGQVVHIPTSIFPDEADAPECGYWMGKTVRTKGGGMNDIGIRIPNEEVFTRPRSEVATWIARP
jgi:hypothetical protein